MRVVNSAGELVLRPFTGTALAGVVTSHVWDVKNDEGAPVASGVYVVRLESQKFKTWAKVAVTR